jgi:HK97 family phage portal protein
MAAAMDAARVRNATMREPEWWRQSLGGRTSITGHNVTPESALAVTAVFGCVRVLAESVASLPMMVYRRLPDGGKEVATQHPLYRLLHDGPNRDQTAFEAGEFRMACLGLRGNSYSALTLNGRGDVVAIHPLRPQYMQMDRDSAGHLVFDYREPGAERVYTQDRIWFTRGFGTDGITGLSPIGVCREAIGYAMTLNEHGSRMFANGAKVPGVLEMESTLSDDAYKRLKDDFAAQHEGAGNAGRTLILEGGAKYTQIGMNAADAEFIASQKMQIAEIARIFRVPLHMLNELDKATFSNIEHQSLEFVTHTLRPWLVRIEQSANRDLFGPLEGGKYFVEFKLDALLRGDIKSRYEAYQVAVTNGWMNRNEVRQLENLNPEDGLDEFLVPLNMSGANEPKPEEPAKPDTKAEAQAKACRIEAVRLSASDFNCWAIDYFRRQSEKDGTDYSGRLKDLLDLGVDAATAKWTSNA